MAPTVSAMSISDSDAEDDDRKQKRTRILESHRPSASSAASAAASSQKTAIPSAPRNSIQIDLTDDTPEIETPELSRSYLQSLSRVERDKLDSTQNAHDLMFIEENKKLKSEMNELLKRMQRLQAESGVLTHRVRHMMF